MSQFEFFMAFYGLLLGLGVAEILAGFANLVRERTSPKLGFVMPLLAVVVFVEMIANFIDAWRKFSDIAITLPQLAIPTLIGILYYFIASILMPRDLHEWSSLDDYFDARRR